jgi:hypothetical protein
VDLGRLPAFRSYASPPELYVAGRCVARRPARDAAVRLGPGVVVVRGGFCTTGGSAKRPALAPEDGTILEIRGVPRPAAEAERQRYPEAVTLVDEAPAPALPAIEEQIRALLAQLPDERHDALLRAVLAQLPDERYEALLRAALAWLSPERREALVAELAAGVATTA